MSAGMDTGRESGSESGRDTGMGTDGMTRAEALAVLGLPLEASAEQIEQRYTLLIRRLRSQTDEASIAQLTAANAAYAALKAASVPPRKFDPQSEQLFFGKTRAHWANWWHYERWKVLGAIAGIAVLVYFIVTIVTNKPADFKIVAVGNFNIQSEEVSMDDVNNAFQSSVVASLPEHPEIEKTEIEWIMLEFNADGTFAPPSNVQVQQAAMMKVMARFGADDLDVILFDQGGFINYANQMTFVDLAPLVETLKSTMPAEQFAKIKILHNAPEGQPVVISGLDITALDLMTPMGLVTDSTIVTVGPLSKKPDLAIQWLASWISSSTKP
ncbi:MAG: molecular chaperone DnaJ [Firmicutes bacterium]|nr:molecular chaperone DnaJ [Bacillota bacterium]